METLMIVYDDRYLLYLNQAFVVKFTLSGLI